MTNHNSQNTPSMEPVNQSSRFSVTISSISSLLQTLRGYKSQTQKGSVLIYLVAVMLVGGALGAGIVSMTTSSTFTQLTYNQSDQARWLAQSGIEYAKSYLNNINEDEREEAAIELQGTSLWLDQSQKDLISYEQVEVEPGGNYATVTVIGKINSQSSMESNFKITQSFRLNTSTDWRNAVPPGTAQEPATGSSDATATEFRPYERELSDGTLALIFGEHSDLSDPNSPHQELETFRYSCAWSPDTYSVANDPFQVCFRFQFFPGETDRSRITGTADGFTMTLLPGDFDIGNEDDGYVCGFSGSNLGYGGIDSPKMAIEFDIHRYGGNTGGNQEWSPNDPFNLAESNFQGNHVALLLSQDAGLPDPEPWRFYNVRHGHYLNPMCDPELPSQSACVFMYDSSSYDVSLPAWLEWRACNINTYPNCEMEFVDQDVWWRSPNNLTFPHIANVSVHRGCNNDCTSCGIGGEKTRVMADIYCLYGSSNPTNETDRNQTDYCGLPRNIDACVLAPLDNDIFDEVRLGFTTATGAARTGLQISHIDFDCNPFPTPIAEYRFDECSWDGTPNEVIDSSVRNNHGRAVNNATTVAGGILGRAGRFNADENQYIDVPHSSDLEMSTGNQVTVAGWIRQTSDQTNEDWITILSKSNESYALQLQDGNMPRFTIYDNTNYTGNNRWRSVNANQAINQNVWYHLAGTFDGETVRIYVDGVLQDEEESAGQIRQTNLPLFFAHNSGAINQNRHFDGYLDEFKIYDVALSPARIYSMYYNESRDLDWDGRNREPIFCPVDNIFVDENVFVYGTTFTGLSSGSPVVEGDGATVALNDDLVLGGAARVNVSNIFVDGDLTLGGSSTIGSETNPGIICIGGDLNLGVSSNIKIFGTVYVNGDFHPGQAKIYGNVYVTGYVRLDTHHGSAPEMIPSSNRIFYLGGLNTGNQAARIQFADNHCVYSDSLPACPKPDFGTPVLRPDAWYASKGYQSSGTLVSNIKIFSEGDYHSGSGRPTATDVVIVSKGDINISMNLGAQVELTGVLFAPYGKVTFSGANFTGTVIARDGFFSQRDNAKIHFKNISDYIDNPDDYPFLIEFE